MNTAERNDLVNDLTDIVLSKGIVIAFERIGWKLSPVHADVLVNKLLPRTPTADTPTEGVPMPESYEEALEFLAKWAPEALENPVPSKKAKTNAKKAVQRCPFKACSCYKL